MDLKFSNRHVAFLIAIVVITPALVAGYPLPGSDKQAPVVCNGCVGLNFSGQPNAGKPTWSYSAPIAKHIGRLVDSSSTKDIQAAYGGASGTVRANKIRVAPGNQTRVYVKMGRGIGAYTLSTFFSSTLPRGMQPVTAVADVKNTRTKYNSPNEDLTVWDAYVYAENYGANWPSVGADDKQDVLHDFDVDDRGLIYTAYTVWGWGISQDSGETGGALLPLLGSTVDSASVITVVKAGTKYYVAVGDGSLPTHKLYDVTSPANRILIGTRNFGIRSWAHYDAGSRTAIIDHENKLRIYSNTTFADGGAPLLGPLAAGSGSSFSDITFDESGNLWATEESGSYTAKIQRFTPNSSGYTQSTFGVGESFSAKANLPNSQLITAAGGYLAVAGSGLRGADVMLFKVEGSTIRQLDLKNYFNKYYHNAPAGYANPPSDYSYVVSSNGLRLIKQNNKMYLMYNAHGIGDVYEIEAGDSIAASMRTNSFGSNNPHSKGDAGPYPGDVVKLVAASSNPAVSHQVSWDFGNPESGRNLAQTATGVEVSHQFSGYTTANQITAPKKVTATAVNDASLTDTVTVTLKVPVARIGVSNRTAAVTAAGPAFSVIAGDSFNDASDGSVESHYASWNIDGTTTKLLPGQTLPAGAIGPHSVSLTAFYGRYDASTLTTVTSAYGASVSNVPYVVRPFIFTLGAVKSGANAVFSAAERHSTTPFLTAQVWTVTWTLKDGNTVIQAQSATEAVGNIAPFSVAMASIPATGTAVVTLDVSVPAATVAGPAEYATYSQSMTLDTPNPVITKSGCANAGAPCTLTASSATSKPTADWVFSWTLTNGTTTLTGTGNPYTPNITVAGNYTATVVATKGIFSANAETVVNVAGVACGPPPTADQIAILASCGACKVGDTVTFRTSVYNYPRQDCDVYTWSFGDNSPSKTGTTVTHAYASANTYTARLTVSNTSGSPATTHTTTVAIGGGPVVVDPPTPTCTRPANLGITYSGNQGCGPGIACKVGERVNFTGTKNNGEFLSTSCDTAAWEFGDGGTASSRTPNHTYTTAGAFTVTLRVSSSAGSATPVSVTIPVVPGTTGGTCSGSATSDNLVPEFRGADSRCSAINGDLCRRNETIQFDVKAFAYIFQTCDKFEWTFGDGSVSTLKNPTHAYAGSNADYIASVRVYNSSNPTGTTMSMRVPFDAAPIVPTPAIQLSTPATAAKGQAITFTANSNLDTTTGWTWDFGDGTPKDTSQAGIVARTSTVTHVFATAGTRTITVSARNSLSTSTALTAISTNQVTISDVPVHKFLLPAVIHAGGLNGSSWRSDVQVYYGAPNPAAEPLKMTASFNGVETPLEINRSTFIYDDVVSSLTNGAGGQGTVILTTQTPYKPQIWTRTYNVDASGKTFGQFIPAIELVEAAGNSPNSQPNKYYLSGLRHDSRYRTNVGLINTTSSDVIADVTAYDDLQTPLDRFSVTLSPFALQQFGVSKVKNLTNRPVSLEISVPAGKRIVGYASLIDGASNDPVYISATSDEELASRDYATSITPGVGHIGSWRSDVTIFNPDDRSPVTFDLAYYDAAGLRRGLATNLTLGPLQAKNYEDLLRVNNLFSPTPPDGVGMLKLTTQSQQARYPLTFSRTYNDKGAGGTFGQGIAGVAAARANVVPGKSAIIAGVRSGANYKTNIGLTNTTGNTVNVRVQLLDPVTGSVAHEEAYSLVGDASVVGTFPFPATLTQGALRINITSGAGGVWAFASVIDTRSEDPEYVPATPIP